MEYPGWDVQFVYYAHSGASFSNLFSNLNNVAYDWAVELETFDKNFANESLHGNLKMADKIVVVIYDERDLAREELTFEGSGDANSWFSVHYLVKSLHWDTSKLLEASSFKFNPSSADFQFEITTNSESSCGVSGFFQITCDISTDCEELKWWTQDAALEEKKPCGILYSKWITSVDYSAGYWASRIQIISKTGWERVFMFESFAGIDPYQYYKTGNEINPAGGDFHSDMVFRDLEIEMKINGAKLIRLSVFDKEKTQVVSNLVFNANGDFESWFERNNINKSSLWKFEALDNPTSATFFTISAPSRADYRFFYINHKWAGCPGDTGWLMVTTSNGTGCEWEHWWTLDVVNKSQPPFIHYSSIEGPQKSSEWHHGGKIELSVS